MYLNDRQVPQQGEYDTSPYKFLLKELQSPLEVNGDMLLPLCEESPLGDDEAISNDEIATCVYGKLAMTRNTGGVKKYFFSTIL